ncbi:Tn3 family transposase [Calothrix parietina]|uniref:Tn3 family transposase n=1 Tax=Calothrix parietina FACHB-288 TaxID=2692896 RepID=A0ABR8AMZ6_9CYAN|nr:Tn3 family transposase [Calothrix parietina]MBD2200925.1 Tn3 family transposase [Calothrix parietina FACHB-288]
MKRNWQPEELVECWTLLPNELELLVHKKPQNRLIFALLLKFFELEARFPESEHEIPAVVVNYVTQQLKISPSIYRECNWQGRSIIYYRKKIREFFGFQEASKKDALQLTDWLTEQALIYELKYEQLKSAAISRLRELKIEPPTHSRLERITRSALSSFESIFFQRTVAQLSSKTKEQIDNFFKPQKIEEQSLEVVSQLDIDDEALLVWNELKLDPGRIGVGSFQKEIEKLSILRQLDLPPDLFTNISTKILQQYKQRVVVEYPKDLRRHPEPIRYTLVAIFALLRSQEIVDNLVELIIQIVHRIGAKAEKRIDQELLKDFKKVNGKTNLLFQMAEASLQQPDGVIKDVIFPVVSETTLKNLVKEYKSTGNAYRERVYTVMRSSYGRHYRRILPLILQQLEFRSNNEVHRPVIQALELLKKYAQSNQRYYDSTEDIPIVGVLRSGWQELILEKNSDGDIKVNRINYELSVLQALREKLRCKEIWVVGAYRYRNPEEDLPTDFESQRTEYFQALKLPDDVEEFITDLQQKMQSALSQLESGLPKNKYVKIKNQGKSKICVSPLKPQSEPINLYRLKTEINRRWPKTSLLDVLKETDLRVNFTENFQSVLTREVLDSKLLQKRLLLCLYGLGTNTGLKRLSDEIGGSSYQELLHVKRAYIHKQQLRNAITNIANAIFGTRLKHIWGEGTAACASDSKKFGAWDQNLMTEWHIRYGGRGVMIYWHVEKNSVCIYSQLKTCSSSEVAAMIEGLLRHCTEMKVEKNFVDSHGQSEVAFAFCHLLGFQLMPRLKRINVQKLYLPINGSGNDYPNLQPVLTRSINWDLIRQQYDQMIKYATALRLGMAETDAILKRFTRGNLLHPTYQALCELGKAVKTIFLSQYLHSLELRREINDGLNVVENWNSANSFIFYGKGGEVATNRLEDQELAILSLHLLQISLVYINTLMIQQVLSQPQWMKLMKKQDLRALSPLIWLHINPYGTFNLDMNERLPIETVA